MSGRRLTAKVVALRGKRFPPDAIRGLQERESDGTFFAEQRVEERRLAAGVWFGPCFRPWRASCGPWRRLSAKLRYGIFSCIRIVAPAQQNQRIFLHPSLPFDFAS